MILGYTLRDKQLAAVERRLRTLGRKELSAFQTIFDTKEAQAYSWPLWGAAYLINGGCSDDGFVYFRAWLISQGEGVYTAALEEPDTLAAVVDPERDDYEFEDLLGIAREVYEDTFEDDMPATPGSWPASPQGERWDFDDDEATAARLPRLSKLYI